MRLSEEAIKIDPTDTTDVGARLSSNGRRTPDTDQKLKGALHLAFSGNRRFLLRISGHW